MFWSWEGSEKAKFCQKIGEASKSYKDYVTSFVFFPRRCFWIISTFYTKWFIAVVPRHFKLRLLFYTKDTTIFSWKQAAFLSVFSKYHKFSYEYEVSSRKQGLSWSRRFHLHCKIVLKWLDSENVTQWNQSAVFW